MWVPYLLRCHRRPRADANLDLMCPGISILLAPTAAAAAAVVAVLYIMTENGLNEPIKYSKLVV